MDIHPGLAKFYQANSPFMHTNMTFAPMQMQPTPMLPAVNWLLNRGLVTSPTTPRFPVLPTNMNMFLGDMNSMQYGFSAVLADDQQFRRRRSLRARTPSPIWTPPEATSQTLVPVNSSTPQSGGKIVGIAYADPTGGSMLVTRRRQDGHLDVRVVYSREFIIAASASPYALLPPANFRQMVLEMMEIIAKFPKSYYNSIRPNLPTSSSE